MTDTTAKTEITANAHPVCASIARRALAHDGQNLLWHYSPGIRLQAIADMGYLRPSNAGADTETPLLWFSSNQKWEPTASKMVMTNAGRLHRLTFEEQAQRFRCVRFGINVIDARILNWPNACALAGTPRRIRREMEKLGKHLGASPAQWFACPDAVALDELVFEVWQGRWCRGINPSAAALAWKQSDCAVYA